MNIECPTSNDERRTQKVKRVSEYQGVERKLNIKNKKAKIHPPSSVQTTADKEQKSKREM